MRSCENVQVEENNAWRQQNEKRNRDTGEMRKWKRGPSSRRVASVVSMNAAARDWMKWRGAKQAGRQAGGRGGKKGQLLYLLCSVFIYPRCQGAATLPNAAAFPPLAKIP